MSEVKVNKVTPRSGTTLTIGDSGDTTNVVGTLQNNGAALVGDISSVVAGTNLSGGGTSGAVTINLADASTSAKGASSFSSDNFAASSGAITIKDLGVATAEIQDDAVTTDKLANSINAEITANTAKTTNATHSGEVTGATALTIADNIVDEANLKVSNSPTNGYFLSAQSGNTGGMTWAEAGGVWVRTHYTQIGNAGATQIDFTGLSSDYEVYKFYFVNIRPETDDVFMKFFMNVGGSFQTGNYGYAIRLIDTNDTSNTAAAPEDNAFAKTIVNEVGNATGETLNGELTIFDPSGTTNKNVITTNFNNINKDGRASSNVGVISNMSSAAALTGIRIKYSSGKMLAGGLIIGYGLKA